MKKSFLQGLLVFGLTAALLSIVQVKVKNPILTLERFVEYGGWIQISLLALFAVFLYSKMSDIVQSAKWRRISWTIFACWFFLQLIIGMTVNEKFLMSGTLHLPVPSVIIGGSIFRFEFSFMPILFLSTILLTGPAWCSRLCYFGAFDNLSSDTSKKTKVKSLFKLRNVFLFAFILGVLLLRLIGVSAGTAAIAGGIFGLTGVFVILFLSSKTGTMVHCSVYCPVGTLTSWLKYINPFRMYIDQNCDRCMKCTKACRYAALEKPDIEKSRPGFGCTYCADCLVTCPSKSIKFRFFGFSPETSYTIYTLLTVVVFIIFLALAKI